MEIERFEIYLKPGLMDVTCMIRCYHYQVELASLIQYVGLQSFAAHLLYDNFHESRLEGRTHDYYGYLYNMMVVYEN